MLGVGLGQVGCRITEAHVRVHIQEEAQPKIAQVLGLSNADTVLDVPHDDHGNIRHGNIRHGNISRGKIRRGNISHGICMSRPR